MKLPKIISGAKAIKNTDTCEIHKAPRRTANLALFTMVLASLLIVIWHVYRVDYLSPELSQKDFLARLWTEISDITVSKHGFLAELWNIFPYYLIGILLAGFIRTYKLAIRMRAYLNRYGFLSVFLASLIGILTPLCACGTLTTAVSLLFAGIPLAPVMALITASPLLSPSAYLLTLNDLGPEWTAIRTIAAFSMGIFAGTVTHILRNKGFQTDNIIIEGAIPRGDFHDEAYPDSRLKCNCKEKFGNRIAARTRNKFIIFLAKSSDMVWLVGKYVLVGVLIGTVVERYMPYEWIYRLFGQKSKLNILWITLGSVPIFVHQISASSILFHIKSSLQGTLDGGAALAFLIGGPVTAIPTLTVFWTMFKKKVFFLYMFICIAGTLMIAYLFQWLVFVPYADMGNPLLKGVDSISGGKSPIIQKEDKTVRVVMDPDGKAIIAQADDYTNGKGRVVFDSGLDKFMHISATYKGNRNYIKNTAEWLEEGSGNGNKKILIYNLFQDTGSNNSLTGMSSLLQNEYGFKVTLTDRKETPEISRELLSKYSQVWVFFGGPEKDFLSGEEADIISDFNNTGNGILINAGNSNVKEPAGANRLSSRFGVKFTGSVENREEITVSTSSYFLNRVSETVGKILKFTGKA